MGPEHKLGMDFLGESVARYHVMLIIVKLEISVLPILKLAQLPMELVHKFGMDLLGIVV